MDSGATPEAPGPASPATPRRTRVLVVDDELGVRESLRLVLRDGFEVIPAESGEQALALLATERPDVVLLDILMPGIDGLA
ncbi:MAG: response regulator, partial [Deltaproteobacteria bacterium]